MMALTQEHISHLIDIESHIHYGEPPPPNVTPFIVINRDSPILLSAPHGSRTYRNTPDEVWHEEDEYTGGMALLLSELCGISVISTIWRTDDSDPNFHGEARSPYKQTVRRISSINKIQWVIDLHGASQGTPRMDSSNLVDLGTRQELYSLPATQLNQLQNFLENRLGNGKVHHNGFPAKEERRSITAFFHGELGLHAVQVEMKPSVRVALRRVDATMYGKALSEGGGPYSAPADQILAMMQALVEFIEYVKSIKE
jgi:hypothetical protein